LCSDEEDLAGLPNEIGQVQKGCDLFGGGAIPQLLGGTAFAFSCEEAQGALDYPFVDEAGQVSLANLVWSENWICMKKMRYFATAVRRTR
jgi:uncharacterized protein